MHKILGSLGLAQEVIVCIVHIDLFTLTLNIAASVTDLERWHKSDNIYSWVKQLDKAPLLADTLAPKAGIPLKIDEQVLSQPMFTTVSPQGFITPAFACSRCSCFRTDWQGNTGISTSKMFSCILHGIGIYPKCEIYSWHAHSEAYACLLSALYNSKTFVDGHDAIHSTQKQCSVKQLWHLPREEA